MAATLKATKTSKTSNAKTREMLASAAGLAPSPANAEVPFNPETATFKVTVSSPIGPYTVGQVLEAPYQWSNLPEQKQITTYYDLALSETIGEHELKPKQIWHAIQAVGVDDAADNPDEIDGRRIEYLQTVQSSTTAMSQEEFVKFLTTNEVAAAAVKLGESVSEELQVAVELGIDAKKTWDGTPIKVEQELVKHYGDNALQAMPLVNSRKTGKLNRQMQSTDTVPPDYTGVTDYFIGDVKGEQRVVRWFQLFVEAMPHVRQLVNRRELLSTMKSAPASLDAKLIPVEYMEIWNNGAPDETKLAGARADVGGDISKYVNRVTQAVAFYQAKKAIDAHLSQTVSYELVGGSVEASYKRTKPIQMLALKPDEKYGVRAIASMAPVALSKFIRYGRNAEKCKAQGGQLNKLEELSKVQKKATPKATAGVDTAATSFKIEKAAQLEDIFTNAKDYIGQHINLVKERLADKREGGRFCYQLVTLRDELDALIAEDKNGNSPVVQRATAWHKEQMLATANMDKDDAERKRNLATATN